MEQLSLNKLQILLGSKALAGLAYRIVKRLSKLGMSKAAIAAQLYELQANPQAFLEHEHWAKLAIQLHDELQQQKEVPARQIMPPVRPTPLPYAVFGDNYIDAASRQQMDQAMRLPIALAGALMPDAHVGYGLPIGGVLATQPDAVVPYAVGVDIACRMCMSIWDIEESYLLQNTSRLRKILGEHTFFGIDARNPNPLPDVIWDKPEWRATPLIRSLYNKARQQLGTSGTGNHFVEWGILEVFVEDDSLALPIGRYLALLSHSGSRGFGAAIAMHYTKRAQAQCHFLPKEMRHLAWLTLDTADGQEYWLSMQLAGSYAAANHHQIHRRIALALGLQPIRMLENHHNFAWKEKLPDGRQVVVHRKGATPAHAGVLGIIPGSMTQAGYVVKGLGCGASIYSASHGAGRLMSRSEALRSLKADVVSQYLHQKGVDLIGGDLDEAPMVYKDLEGVLALQKKIVKKLAAFHPKIVRMAEPDRRPWARED